MHFQVDKKTAKGPFSQNNWSWCTFFVLYWTKVAKGWQNMRLKCIMRTFIHPSKGDSPYSPFHSPFLKGESPFSKGEWASGKKIHPSKRVNVFTLEGESPFKKGESPSKRVNHPSEGWVSKKSELKKGEWRVNHPFQGWMKKGWIE